MQRILDEKQINTRLENLESLLKNQNLQEKDILSLEEACKYLSITKSQIYMLTSKKLIAHSKPGGKMIFFKRVDLLGWATSNRISTNAELEMKASQQVNNAYPFKQNKRAS